MSTAKINNRNAVCGKKSSQPIRIGKRECDAIRREIAAADLVLHSAAGDCQLAMLPKLLRYLGPRGLGTVEAEALGYRRIATRIQDIEVQGFLIHSGRESVITDDQLLHRGMARYFLVGEPPAAANLQPNIEADSLDGGVEAANRNSSRAAANVNPHQLALGY